MRNLIPPLNWECAQGLTLEIYIDEREDIAVAAVEEGKELATKRIGKIL